MNTTNTTAMKAAMQRLHVGMVKITPAFAEIALELPDNNAPADSVELMKKLMQKAPDACAHLIAAAVEIHAAMTGINLRQG